MTESPDEDGKGTRAEQVGAPLVSTQQPLGKSEPTPIVIAPTTPAAQPTPASSASSRETDDTSAIPQSKNDCFKVWPADRNGAALMPRGRETVLEASLLRDPNAVEIYYGVPGGPPGKELVDLQDQVDRALTTVRRLYLESSPPQPERFRRWYVRLFQVAHLGLEGPAPLTALAAGALSSLTQELIDDESPRVKNEHLRVLGSWVARYSFYAICVYIVLGVIPQPMADALKSHFTVERDTAKNFMLLWVGCFWGVWLSYAIRSANFALVDLTRTDSDRLLPQHRLVFIGSLTMLLGLLFSFGIVEIKLGSFPISAVGREPVLALIVGLFCGISESALPGSVAQRAAAFVGGLK